MAPNRINWSPQPLFDSLPWGDYVPYSAHEPSPPPSPFDGYTVTGSRYAVELLPTEETLPSGLVLPQTAVPENWTDGLVVAAGPGKEWPSGVRQTMMAFPGERVVFTQDRFQQLAGHPRHGFVSDHDVCALVSHGGDLSPANGWLQVRPDPAPTHTGLLEIPQECRRRPCSGTVLSCGPGAVRVKGDLAGTRVPIPLQLGLTQDVLDSAPYLEGQRVQWSEAATVIELTGDDTAVCSVLVHVDDLLALILP